ncbi:MAG: hypothetical protein ABIS59_01770 [Candidatus Saccharibacteria bacterium]
MLLNVFAILLITYFEVNMSYKSRIQRPMWVTNRILRVLFAIRIILLFVLFLLMSKKWGVTIAGLFTVLIYGLILVIGALEYARALRIQMNKSYEADPGMDNKERIQVVEHIVKGNAKR